MGDADRNKWDARYAARVDAPVAPDQFLVTHAHMLPRTGRALDVAGGAGRHAVWLATRGLDTTLADISETGLSIARALAETAGVHVETAAVDLEHEPLPAGPWDVVLVFHYLYRPLFPQLIACLAPGGLLAYCQPTRKNLERHIQPSARFLLDESELPTLIGDLEVVHYDEGWSDSGRHEARLIARRL